MQQKTSCMINNKTIQVKTMYYSAVPRDSTKRDFCTMINESQIFVVADDFMLMAQHNKLVP